MKRITCARKGCDRQRPKMAPGQAAGWITFEGGVEELHFCSLGHACKHMNFTIQQGRGGEKEGTE